MDSKNTVSLMPNANPALVYNDDKRETVIQSLIKGGRHMFYGPGGTGKTYEAMALANILSARGYSVLIVAVANEAAHRFGGKGIFNAFGFSVDRITGGPTSKLDDLCRAVRRSNPNRANDPLWDKELPSASEMKDYEYMVQYTLKGTDPATLTDVGIISKINRFYSKYKQADCANALFEMRKQIFIFEECFMMGKRLFNMVDRVLRKYREVDLPFGGAGVLLCGDALQIPPIKDQFIFHSNAWAEIAPVVHLFTEAKRFEQDPFFLEFLQRARIGKLTEEDHIFLMSRRKSLVMQEAVYSLCNTRDETETKNAVEFSKLTTQRYSVNAQDQYFQRIPAQGGREETKMGLMESLIPEAKRVLGDVYRATELHDVVKVAVGARVVINHNDRETCIFNGHTGTVKEVIFTEYSPEAASIYGKKGYIETVKIEFDREFTHSVHSTTELVVAGNVVMLGTRACLVKKVVGNNFSSIDTVIVPKMTINHAKGDYIVTRSQYPFSLAWARTINKAQGATVEEGIIPLSGFITSGKSYVAVSRFKSSSHLIIEDNYNRSAFYANADGLAFDQTIQSEGVWRNAVEENHAPRSEEFDSEMDDPTSMHPDLADFLRM